MFSISENPANNAIPDNLLYVSKNTYAITINATGKLIPSDPSISGVSYFYLFTVSTILTS